MKLLIADDEKIFRETIRRRIHWEELGIDTVLFAANGIEAYDIILDEYPDIVITDIKMPGLSGIELIQRIRKLTPDIEFIILSGYGEFDFAREAMLCGVKHYLVKPCNEKKIVAALRSVMEDVLCKSRNSQLKWLPQLMETMVINLINEGVAREQLSRGEYDSLLSPYRKFLNLDTQACEICFFYYMEEQSAQYALDIVNSFFSEHYPELQYHVLYVHETMLLLLPSFTLSYDRFDSFMRHISLNRHLSMCEYKRQHLESMADALWVIITKIRRYDTIIYFKDNNVFTICNFRSILSCVVESMCRLFDQDSPENTFKELMSLLRQVTDVAFLKQLIASVLMYSASKCLYFSSVNAADFLAGISQETSTQKILSAFEEQMQEILSKYHTADVSTRKLSLEICRYVDTHLSDSNLSLRQLAENYLYMNVDYVSKRFLKETGIKFSKYVTDKRIEKAKELLAGMGVDKIQDVAELVGCGNNPQYFSQLFKKETGMTPSAYIRQQGGKA